MSWGSDTGLRRENETQNGTPSPAPVVVTPGLSSAPLVIPRSGIQHAAAFRIKHRSLEYWIARTSRATTQEFGR